MFVKPTTNRRELWDTDNVYEIIKRRTYTRNDSRAFAGPLYTFFIRDSNTKIVKHGRYYREELHPVEIGVNKGGDTKYLRDFLAKQEEFKPPTLKKKKDNSAQ